VIGYRSYLRNHILPRSATFRRTRSPAKRVKVFIKDLESWLADSSAASTLGLLSLVMREAVADRRFGRFHPCQSVRVVTSHRAERSTATTAEGRPHRRPDRPPR
jgi:hypothetical protein